MRLVTLTKCAWPVGRYEHSHWNLFNESASSSHVPPHEIYQRDQPLAIGNATDVLGGTTLWYEAGTRPSTCTLVDGSMALLLGRWTSWQDRVSVLLSSQNTVPMAKELIEHAAAWSRPCQVEVAAVAALERAVRDTVAWEARVNEVIEGGVSDSDGSAVQVWRCRLPPNPSCTPRSYSRARACVPQKLLEDQAQLPLRPSKSCTTKLAKLQTEERWVLRTTRALEEGASYRTLASLYQELKSSTYNRRSDIASRLRTTLQAATTLWERVQALVLAEDTLTLTRTRRDAPEAEAATAGPAKDGKPSVADVRALLADVQASAVSIPYADKLVEAVARIDACTDAAARVAAEVEAMHLPAAPLGLDGSDGAKAEAAVSARVAALLTDAVSCVADLGAVVQRLERLRAVVEWRAAARRALAQPRIPVGDLVQLLQPASLPAALASSPDAGSGDDGVKPTVPPAVAECQAVIDRAKEWATSVAPAMADFPVIGDRKAQLATIVDAAHASQVTAAIQATIDKLEAALQAAADGTTLDSPYEDCVAAAIEVVRAALVAMDTLADQPSLDVASAALDYLPAVDESGPPAPAPDTDTDTATDADADAAAVDSQLVAIVPSLQWCDEPAFRAGVRRMLRFVVDLRDGVYDERAAAQTWNRRAHRIIKATSGGAAGAGAGGGARLVKYSELTELLDKGASNLFKPRASTLASLRAIAEPARLWEAKATAALHTRVDDNRAKQLLNEGHAVRILMPTMERLSARSRALEWHTRAKLTLNRFKQHTPERELAMLVTQGNAAVAGAYDPASPVQVRWVALRCVALRCVWLPPVCVWCSLPASWLVCS